ncbi:cold shock domain-containing protein [Desulfobacterota bacterium AH_259_B03_O07]|nr:cold shock domain-containing protein [Desulfobacterota bacterium AH_259_B03_O07]
MIKGKISKVIKVVEDGGYGFIGADDGRKIFFHVTVLQEFDIKDLKEGDLVEFNVKNDPHERRPRALNVRKASD